MIYVLVYNNASKKYTFILKVFFYDFIYNSLDMQIFDLLFGI